MNHASSQTLSNVNNLEDGFDGAGLAFVVTLLVAGLGVLEAPEMDRDGGDVDESKPFLSSATGFEVNEAGRRLPQLRCGLISLPDNIAG